MGNMVSEYYYLTKSKNKSIITKDNIRILIMFLNVDLLLLESMLFFI